jgi:hypothetical protein
MSKPPGETTDPVAAEIETEIADHLATCAEQLEAQGLATAAARQKSEAKFGDAATISRRCYWIKQGDTLMFRAAIIALLSLLCFALGLATFSGYRSQRRMAEQMTALAEQLKVLADQQKKGVAIPPPTETKPLEITGHVFVASPDKPSINTEVMICRVSDGEIVRRVETNENGSFQSGPLTAGDYAVVADGVRHPSWKGAISIQTAPIYLYPSAPTTNLAIDAAYRSGQIAVKLSRPLPKVQVEGKYKIDSRLYLLVSPSSSSLRTVRWTVAEPPPDQWPVYIQDAEQPPLPSNPDEKLSRNIGGAALLSNAKLEDNPRIDFGHALNPLPAGACGVRALIVADVLPDGPVDLDEMIFNRRSGYRHSEAERQWMSDYWAVNETLGQVWLFTLARRLQPKVPYTSLSSLNHVYLRYRGPVTNVTIADGCLTSLLIAIPDDVESRIQQLVETVTDQYKFKDAVEKENPFVRDAKTTIIGTEPLKPDDATRQR